MKRMTDLDLRRWIAKHGKLPTVLEVERQGCHCEGLRQPCPYHKGWAAGYDAALDGVGSRLSSESKVANQLSLDM